MNYSKPCLVSEGCALQGVHTVEFIKGPLIKQDRNYPEQTTMTAGAYDADE
jgi:hypothetical protein